MSIAIIVLTTAKGTLFMLETIQIAVSIIGESPLGIHEVVHGLAYIVSMHMVSKTSSQ